MIKPSNPNYSRLTFLFQEQPLLFEEIDLQEYTDEDEENLYRDGESDLININGKKERFNWEDVDELGIEEDFEEDEDE